LKLRSRRERFFFLRELLNYLREVDNLISLDFLRWQLMLLSKECLAGLAQLRESIVHHLLFAIDVSIAHLVELIDAFLGNSLVVMLLLGA
jgi:hypothetical protein